MATETAENWKKNRFEESILGKIDPRKPPEGEHITHLHTSDIVTFETDITDT